MNVVVITQNQAGCIPEMVSRLREAGLDRIIYVLDNCSDGSDGVCSSLGVHYVETPKRAGGRKTSSARNFGYLAALHVYGDDDTLFLDGDRYPVSGDIAAVAGSETDVTLLKIENDSRWQLRDYSEMYGTVMNCFYSCGIMIKSTAIGVIRDFYAGRRLEYAGSVVFPVQVESWWGVEDTLLGDICYHLGLTCSITDQVTLNGKFDKGYLDSLEALEARFVLREKLDTKDWGKVKVNTSTSPLRVAKSPCSSLLSGLCRFLARACRICRRALRI